MISDSELILNKDGSLYHLNLLPGDLAETIILVGDQNRVPLVSKYFDKIEIKKGKREFVSHTGYLNNKRISVVSTGIGTDNIDIVLNEIDALFNVNLASRSLNQDIQRLNFIRVGTSGSLQEELEMGHLVVSDFAVGFDALMQYYKKPYTKKEKKIRKAIEKEFQGLHIHPYVGRASKSLIEQYAYDLPKGITMTSPGFYAPQGRRIRSNNAIPNLVQIANNFELNERHITNMEMETAGIYALSNMFGHKAISINAILASRVNETFSGDPQEVIDRAIRLVLDRF